jgi:hypothetical protein
MTLHIQFQFRFTCVILYMYKIGREVIENYDVRKKHISNLTSPNQLDSTMEMYLGKYN